MSYQDNELNNEENADFDGTNSFEDELLDADAEIGDEEEKHENDEDGDDYTYGGDGEY